MINRLRILIIDDSEHWLFALADMLPVLFDQVNQKIHIDTADNTKRASKLIEGENRYDVWIVDIRLAGGQDPNDASGLEFIKTYIGTSYLASVKIIIATAYPSYDFVRTALHDLNVSDFAAKSDGINGLFRAICKAVELLS